MHEIITVLAQVEVLERSTPRHELTDQQRFDVLLWGGLLMVVVIIGFGVLMLIRAKLHAKDEPAEQGGFLLGDLRQMRDSGQITEEEFQAARAKIIAKIKGLPEP